MHSIAETQAPPPRRPVWRTPWPLVVLMLTLMIALIWQLGFYTIQPIGALPEGRTVIVWRAAGEPAFNSPDAECLRIQHGVSLLCRGVALSRAPTDRIVLRLPYLEWAYLLSTGGVSFDR